MRRPTSRTPHIVLVTGAASGIGAAAAVQLAEQGVRVAAVDIETDRLSVIAKSRSHLTPFCCDVADEEAVRVTVAQVESTLGPIDRVIHCAGIVGVGRLLDQPTSDIRRLMEINYLGTVHVARAALANLTARGYGELIVVASIAGWLPTQDVGAYSASKAAMISFCEVLAAECRDTGVRIVCVCPPAVETPMLDELRRHPHVVQVKRGLPAYQVIDAADKALAKNHLFAFPGRSTKTIWRARRFAPRLLGGVLESLLKQTSTERASAQAEERTVCK